MRDIHNFRWPLLGAFFVSFVFTLPFIINNNFLLDDWLRSDNGNSGWEGNGRPFASMLMSGISLFPHGRHFFGDNSLFDLFPLPLILSSAILVFSGFIFCKAMKVDGQIKAFIICSIPVCNPFWVGNIEFRHDSLIMSLSFALAVSSGYIANKSLKMSFLAAVMLAVSLGLYQTSINAYISMCLCVLLASFLSGDKTWNKSALSIFCVIIGYLIYSKLFIHISGFSNYASANAKTFHFGIEMLNGVIRNTLNFFRFCIDTSPPMYLPIIGLLSLCSIIYCLKKHGISLNSGLAILTLIICFLMSFGVLAIFERPAIAARTMMPASIFIMLTVALCSGRIERVTITLASLGVFVSICFCYIISSAINSTDRHDRFIAMHIAGLYAKDSNNGSRKMYITGKPSPTRYVARVIKRLPMAKYMVVSAFANYRFKYSLMAQYGFYGAAPEITDAKRFDNISKSEDTSYSDLIVSSFIRDGVVIYKIK